MSCLLCALLCDDVIARPASVEVDGRRVSRNRPAVKRHLLAPPLQALNRRKCRAPPPVEAPRRIRVHARAIPLRVHEYVERGGLGGENVLVNSAYGRTKVINSE